MYTTLLVRTHSSTSTCSRYSLPIPVVVSSNSKKACWSAGCKMRTTSSLAVARALPLLRLAPQPRLEFPLRPRRRPQLVAVLHARHCGLRRHHLRARCVCSPDLCGCELSSFVCEFFVSHQLCQLPPVLTSCACPPPHIARPQQQDGRDAGNNGTRSPPEGRRRCQPR